ncbi:hypothetical protein HMI54_007859 [Coelomomyces lativittatus]|nr:hypothetical protein HMI56_004123 [Coelomomyces lativittatus]KAJ1516878.1 hypothetical protein HMI54_007859 [Coelomomyces lativittatus]
MLSISSSALVCQDTELDGPISIGEGSILHPKCCVHSIRGGQIIIGKNNLIEEGVTIVNKSDTSLIIGDNNLFEVGCYVAAKSIGNFNVIEPKAYISENTTLEDHCIIGTSSQTQPSQTIKSYTILYGSNPVQQRSHPPEFLHEHDMLFESHLAHLRSVLPKHNQMRKNSL